MHRRLAASAILPAALLLGSCAIQDHYSTDYLRPHKGLVAEPADLGLTAIPADIPVSGGNIRGFLIPADGANGRTVVLFHGSGTDASELHPYYSFLHAAGFSVFAFDYRGFGQSAGDASMHGMVNDTPAVIAWLQARPEVDKQQLAFYGLGIGATVALRTAAKVCDARALVLEDLQSPHDTIYDAIAKKNGEVSAMFATGMAEFSAIPEDLEPDGNIAELKVPTLFLAGAELPKADLKATLRSYLKKPGDKQLWVMPDTGAVPESLATQDGRYQRAVVTFLQSAFAGVPHGLSTECKAGVQGKSDTWCEVTVSGAVIYSEPWAIEVCGLDDEANATFHRVWLRGQQETFKLPFPKQPTLVSAVQCGDVVTTDDGSWKPKDDAMAASMRAYDSLESDLELVRHGEPNAEQLTAIVTRLDQLRQQQPFVPSLDAELADVYYRIGHRLLVVGTDAQKTDARRWLQLAVDSAPENPKLHCWPARVPTFGYPQQAEVDAAKAQLAAMPK